MTHSAVIPLYHTDFWLILSFFYPNVYIPMMIHRFLLLWSKAHCKPSARGNRLLDA